MNAINGVVEDYRGIDISADHQGLLRLWEIEEAHGRHYPAHLAREARAKIEEFKAETGAWGRCSRLIYLYDRLYEVEVAIRDITRDYEDAVRRDAPYLVRRIIALDLPDLEAQRRKLKSEIHFMMHPPKENDLSPEMIERAREYPIGNLVEVNKRGFARCVAHEDRNPSMFTRGNFGHCFSCGYSGDAIDIAMKIHGLDFPEAVRRLQ